MSDTYKIGISVVLGNLMSAELLKIIGQLGVADKAALSFAAKVGVASGAITVFGMALKEGVDEARKFQVEVAKFSLFGMNDRTNREAQAFAENMKIVGTSATEAMRLMVEAQGVFRESGLSDDEALRGAKMSAPMLAKIDFVGKALDEASASRMHNSAQAMLRFIDMQGGLNDPERFNQIANAGFKAIRSSGGNIDWEQYRQFRARGASAAANLSDEALFGEFEPIIQELKGSTAGFALRTAYNRLNAIIRLPNQAAHELVNMGIWDQSKIQWNAQGGIKQFRGNPLRDSDLFARDPVGFYEKYVMPYYNQRGMSAEERTRENAMIFGSTGGNLFNIVERQNPAIHRSVDAWKKAFGIDASVEAAKNTVDGQLVDVTAKWHTLMKEIGQDLLPGVNTGLEGLSKILEAIANFLHDSRDQKSHPILSSMRAALFGMGTLDKSVDPVPPSSQSPVVIDHKTFLDGRVLAESTTKYQIEGWMPGSTSGNNYDLRMTPLAPGH